MILEVSRNKIATYGFINLNGAESKSPKTMLSGEVFENLRVKRVVPSMRDTQDSSNSHEARNAIGACIEIDLGSGGPTSAKAANHAMAAFYATGGGCNPVGIPSKMYKYVPCSPYLFNGDLTLSVISSNSIVIEPISMMPQLISQESADLASISGRVGSVDSPATPISGTIVESASSPCHTEVSFVSISPVRVITFTLPTPSMTSISDYTSSFVVAGASASAPEYQLEYITDTLMFLGMRNSSTGYWVDSKQGVVGTVNLGGPLLACYPSMEQLGVASAVVVTLGGSNFDVKAAVFGSPTSDIVFSRTGTFGDLLLHGVDTCILAYSLSGNAVVETISDLKKTEHTFSIPLPPNLAPQKVFAASSEALVLLASTTVAVPARIIRVGAQQLADAVEGDIAFNMPSARRAKHISTQYGHLISAGSLTVRFDRHTNQMLLLSGPKYPCLYRNTVLCVYGGADLRLLSKLVYYNGIKEYTRVIVNQSETGLVRPYPEISLAGYGNAIWPAGVAGYHPFTPDTPAGGIDMGIAGIVERQGKLFAVQLVTYSGSGYLEPHLIALSDFTSAPSDPFPYGAITYASFPALTRYSAATGGWNLRTIGGVTARVFDPGFFRHQYGWLQNFSGNFGSSYGMADPNPYTAMCYTNRDTAVCTLWGVIGGRSISDYYTISVPGMEMSSLTLNTDLSVDSTEMKGPRPQRQDSAEFWYGQLYSSQQAQADVGPVFGFTTILDAGIERY